MSRMFKIFNLTDIFPVLGGASGSYIALAEKLPSVTSVAVYIVMTILGAVIGYLVKTLLDMSGLKKSIAKLKKRLEQLNKEDNERLSKNV